jgi:hypothetical protein
MPLLEMLGEKATHPLLHRIVTLISRDESRHMAFGILFITSYLQSAPPDERYAFARTWLSRIFQVSEDAFAPHALRLAKNWLQKAGAADPKALGDAMWEENKFASEADRPEALTGRRVDQLLAVARRVGLLAPDILKTLELREHPLVLRALRTPQAQIETAPA